MPPRWRCRLCTLTLPRKKRALTARAAQRRSITMPTPVRTFPAQWQSLKPAQARSLRACRRTALRVAREYEDDESTLERGMNALPDARDGAHCGTWPWQHGCSGLGNALPFRAARRRPIRAADGRGTTYAATSCAAPPPSPSPSRPPVASPKCPPSRAPPPPRPPPIPWPPPSSPQPLNPAERVAPQPAVCRWRTERYAGRGRGVGAAVRE